MNLVEILALFAAMAALALVPSTSVALVVARSCSAGFSNGSAVAAGIVVGDLVFVFLAVSGMAALAEVVGQLFLDPEIFGRRVFDLVWYKPHEIESLIGIGGFWPLSIEIISKLFLWLISHPR